MTCEQSVHLAAYLKGEVSSFEREALRLHLEECPRCAEEARRIGQLLGALAGLPGIEPSRDFGSRVEAALLGAHPEFGREATAVPVRVFSRGALRLAGGLAAGILVAAALWLLLSPRAGGPSNDPSMAGHISGNSSAQYTTGATAGAGEGPAPRDPSPIEFLRNRRPSGTGAAQGTNGAVSRALRWLAGEQRLSGGWFRPDGSPSVGLTGLSLLAFLADGHTIHSQEFGPTVKRGFDFLIWRQLPTGQVGDPEGDSLLDHAIAATALVEASLVTTDLAILLASQKALAYGDYRRSDESVMFWRILMLRLAALGDDRDFTPILDREVLSGGTGPGPLDPALRLFADLVIKPAPSPEAFARQASGLLERPALLGTERGNFQKNDLALAYRGSVAMHEYGGPMEARWLSPLRAKLLRTQEPTGGWPADFDPASQVRGRVYATALAALILESPSRYPRLGN